MRHQKRSKETEKESFSVTGIQNDVDNKSDFTLTVTPHTDWAIAVSKDSSLNSYHLQSQKRLFVWDRFFKSWIALPTG